MVGWSTQAWTSVASSVLSVGECKELQPYCGGQKPFPVLEKKFECQFDWNRIQKPGTFFLLRSRMYTPIDELPPCDLRIFLATKKGPQWIHALLLVIELHVLFLWCCILWPRLFFVTSFFVVSFTASFTEVRIYVSTTYRVRVVYMFTLVPRVLRFNSPVFVSLFSNPFMQFHCPLAPKISTSSLAQRWLHYCWGQWCFAW